VKIPSDDPSRYEHDGRKIRHCPGCQRAKIQYDRGEPGDRDRVLFVCGTIMRCAHMPWPPGTEVPLYNRAIVEQSEECLVTAAGETGGT